VKPYFLSQIITKKARICFKEGGTEGRIGRKKEVELKHRQCKVITLGLDQITKFVYRLDGPLGEGNV
jgi:hypothetical protein